MTEISLNSDKNIYFRREIRDPIFDYIHITNCENKVIDSDPFQRLDQISQMSTSQFVYPSAKYSRKAHSLGVMHLSHKAFLRVLYYQSQDLRSIINPLLFAENIVTEKDEVDSNLDNLTQQLASEWWESFGIVDKVQLIRLAALLHDIGHGPFSHTFEDACRELKLEGRIKKDFDHELMGMKIIKSHIDLKPYTIDNVLEILSTSGGAPNFVKSIVNGLYDCDKLDYLLRDSYHSGTVEYGMIDYERILDGFRVKELKLCISESAIDALMNSFNAIQSMYKSVYYHKTARIFDFMLSDALKMVPEFIEEIIEDEEKFLEYNDNSFIYEIKRRASDDTTYKDSWEIIDDFLKRHKRYKQIFECPISLGIGVGIEKDLQELKKSLEKIAGDLKLKVDYRPDILPMGGSLTQIYTWLEEKNIYDARDGKLKKLEEVNKTYFDQLKHYTILFRIYCERKEYDSSERATIKKLEKEAKNRLNEATSRFKYAS